jgi:D-alanine-D-alanine ligase
MSKRTIAVLFGGRSGEHEVSLRSAASIIEALRKQENVTVLPVEITREGVWLLEKTRVAILPDPAIGGLYLLDGENAGDVVTVDVVFPVLHGTYGEDGTVQGLLELAGIPYVGAGVLGSAVGMDKILMKSVLRQAGLPVGDYLWFSAFKWEGKKDSLISQTEMELGYPCFVKPANLGSSVGISKAYDRQGFIQAVEEALRYDRRILVEKHLSGREIECSVLGNEEPSASVLGEVIPCNDFYDYKAKYIDDRSELMIPAKFSPQLEKKVKELAVETFLALDCAGLGRIDFFVDDNQERIWVNEINTLPGFTSISMYPKLWEASGVSFDELLVKLIGLAIERFKQKNRRETTFQI